MHDRLSFPTRAQGRLRARYHSSVRSQRSIKLQSCCQCSPHVLACFQAVRLSCGCGRNCRAYAAVLASACPGWVCYAEKSHPKTLPHISRIKSPQGIMGTLVKRHLAQSLGVTPAQVLSFSVSAFFMLASVVFSSCWIHAQFIRHCWLCCSVGISCDCDALLRQEAGGRTARACL